MRFDVGKLKVSVIQIMEQFDTGQLAQLSLDKQRLRQGAVHITPGELFNSLRVDVP